MAQVYNKLIPLSTITYLKEYFKNCTFKFSGKHPDYTDKLQWENVHIDSVIKKLLDPYIVEIIGTNYKISPGCGVFQRCYIPFGMHTDSKYRIDPKRIPVEGESDGTAIMIPLDEGPYYNTVFWQKYFKTDTEKNSSFNEFINLPKDQILNNHLGNKIDLDFCWQDPYHKLFNHYELDIIFKWKLGDVAIWNRTQLHAASDFRKHLPFKDAITIFLE